MPMNIQSFLQYIKFEKRFSPNTILAYENDLNQFSLYLSRVYELDDARAVTHSMIRSWMVVMMEEKITPRTINRKITTLKTYFRFLLLRDEAET